MTWVGIAGEGDLLVPLMMGSGDADLLLRTQRRLVTHHHLSRDLKEMLN